MKKAVQIIIQSNGFVAIDAVGFTGADCEKATQYLEEALGTVDRRNKKPEYNQKRKAGQQQKLGS